jgi:glyoxylase-like metal-dependent hydrolase (beta-lactamase superfamily II)
MKIQHFFDKRTSTLTYVVHDEAAKVGVVIDSLMDFDPKSGRTWHESCATIAQYIDKAGLTIPYVLDTHAHADHLSGMAFQGALRRADGHRAAHHDSPGTVP